MWRTREAQKEGEREAWRRGVKVAVAPIVMRHSRCGLAVVGGEEAIVGFTVSLNTDVVFIVEGGGFLS